MPDCTPEEIAALLQREIAPVRAGLADVRGEVRRLHGSLEGDDGLRVRVHVLATRVGALETAVRQATPPDPPGRRPPDPPPAAPPKRRDDSEEGDTSLSLLTLRGKSWAGVVRWLLTALIPGSLVAGGGYYAGSSSRPTTHQAPTDVTAPPPPSPSSGTPEP